ncbi:MAG: carbohydrate kinase family protein [Acidobacteriaceae bacterium]|nr:carbohydrate kinase family protein [Acidobacteriaceae bacterium]
MRPTSDAVLCCGNIVYDTLVRPVEELHWGRGTTFVESIEYRAGGNGASTSRALAILGVPVRLLSVVGADEQGRFILDKLQRAGVDIVGVEQVSAPTAATVAMVNSTGERKFFHRPGASAVGLAAPVFFQPVRSQFVHFHLASFFVLPRLRARGPEPLIHAREAGWTTSFDTNWDPEDGWMQTLEPCLPYIDVLFMNEDEARMITGADDPKTGARVVLGRGTRTAVMKLGRRGCAIYTDDSEILCPAFEVKAKDTTGAGDCFVAGFLAAWKHGASLRESGRFANAVAALTVQHIGAVEGVLSFAETEAWMRNAPLREICVEAR